MIVSSRSEIFNCRSASHPTKQTRRLSLPRSCTLFPPLRLSVCPSRVSWRVQHKFVELAQREGNPYTISRAEFRWGEKVKARLLAPGLALPLFSPPRERGFPLVPPCPSCIGRAIYLLWPATKIRKMKFWNAASQSVLLSWFQWAWESRIQSFLLETRKAVVICAWEWKISLVACLRLRLRLNQARLVDPSACVTLQRVCTPLMLRSVKNGKEMPPLAVSGSKIGTQCKFFIFVPKNNDRFGSKSFFGVVNNNIGTQCSPSSCDILRR